MFKTNVKNSKNPKKTNLIARSERFTLSHTEVQTLSTDNNFVEVSKLNCRGKPNF